MSQLTEDQLNDIVMIIVDDYGVNTPFLTQLDRRIIMPH